MLHTYTYLFILIKKNKRGVGVGGLELCYTDIQGSYNHWNGVLCDNSCGKVYGLNSQSKEIINDRSCSDKHTSTRVNW